MQIFSRSNMFLVKHKKRQSNSGRRRSQEVRFSFRRTVLLGVVISCSVISITALARMSSSQQWTLGSFINEWGEASSFEVGEVFGAFGAIAAGTIALQVMVQTAYSEPSDSVIEYNKRQNLSILTSLGPVASCMLAISVWADPIVMASTSLPYLLIVVSLAGINCFIAFEAIDRLLRLDENNLRVERARVKEDIVHYRLHLLPVDASKGKFRQFLTSVIQSMVLTLVLFTVDVMLMQMQDPSHWFLYYFVFFVPITIIGYLFSLAVKEWKDSSKINRIFMPVLLGPVVLTISFTIVLIDYTNAVLHLLIIVAAPLLIFSASMLVSQHKKQWTLPGWVPGTWVRTHAAEFIRSSLSTKYEKLASIQDKENAEKIRTKEKNHAQMSAVESSSRTRPVVCNCGTTAPPAWNRRWWEKAAAKFSSSRQPPTW